MKKFHNARHHNLVIKIFIQFVYCSHGITGLPFCRPW